MTRIKCIKPLRINNRLLNVGDEFNVVEDRDTPYGHFVRVEGMTQGTYWLFTSKTFEKIA